MNTQSLFWQVEVAFSSIDGKGENIKLENGNEPIKVLPPWMIRQGMKLSDEQRGETKQEAKMASSSIAVESSDDKNTTDEKNDVKNIQVYLDLQTCYVIFLPVFLHAFYIMP